MRCHHTQSTMLFLRVVCDTAYVSNYFTQSHFPNRFRSENRFIYVISHRSDSICPKLGGKKTVWLTGSPWLVRIKVPESVGVWHLIGKLHPSVTSAPVEKSSIRSRDFGFISVWILFRQVWECVCVNARFWYMHSLCVCVAVIVSRGPESVTHMGEWRLATCCFLIREKPRQWALPAICHKKTMGWDTLVICLFFCLLFIVPESLRMEWAVMLLNNSWDTLPIV